MAMARDLAGKKNHVLAVIGDGSLTGGLAFEGLNQAGDMGRRLIVVLNDNEMSILPQCWRVVPLPQPQHGTRLGAQGTPGSQGLAQVHPRHWR